MRRSFLHPYFLCVCLLVLFSAAVSASPAPLKDNNQDKKSESKIVDAVNQALPEARSQLEKVVNINSGTMNFSGVKQVGMVFKKALEDLGFDAQWQDGSSYNRAGSLVASYGTQGKKILLIGHLDTVFAKDDAFQTYQQLDETHAAGPGVSDMKGGDVIMLTAIKALKQAGFLDRISLRVVMTGDEEKSGLPLSASKKAIIDAAKWADVALGFEDGDGDIKTAVIARRGAVDWTLKVTGQPAHSSQIFTEKVGDGAIYEMARILNEFRESLSSMDNLTFNPGLILAGTDVEHQTNGTKGSALGKTNVVSKEAVVMGDIRALSPHQLNKAKEKMLEIVSQSLPMTAATLIFNEGYPPMAATNSNRQLLTLYNQISEDLGYGKVVAVNPRNAGAADISFAANYVDMSLDGLGLMGTGGHTSDEIADMSSFSKNAQKAALLLYRLSEPGANLLKKQQGN
ncbi:M20/M25/M40 family metallo-hydrolase [Shewanella surugensis]|uniref:M20/M25/M40 family metallo-hydrolase n=1 Tax=Shewanella surugensis TaxID=212020 RepID=A0ABT0LAR1_9GAMM|nr:M20/M25/M40 family metallo-hydrolase [Shewanella surugensis]MCL1124793.1 M20/M25/M40 family metallo-hydrolase [Shewanella surugensis]